MNGGNGWKAWMLAIAGVIICGLVALLVTVGWRIYDQMERDHERIYDRLQKLDQRQR